ncbi:MAG: cellulase family glycosylhydrolase [Bacteroidota bacterium]
MFAHLRSLCAIILFVCTLAPQARSQAQVVFKSGFDTKPERGWFGTRRYKMVADDATSSIVFTTKKNKTALLRMALPARELRGKKLMIKARVKAENVGEASVTGKGIKIMMHIHAAADDYWTLIPFPAGSFDWKTDQFITFVPYDADSMWLILGIEKTGGKLWVDNIEITVVDAMESLPAASVSDNEISNYQYGKLRGCMINPTLGKGDIEALGSWGANLIRWQLMWDGFPATPADTATPQVYAAWIERSLEHIDEMLPVCKANNIKIIIDLHTLPGGINKSGWGHKLFEEKVWQEVFIEIWNKIAARYKDEQGVWGFDIANEPNEHDLPAGLMSWQELAAEVARNIRAIDKSHVIIVEGAPNGHLHALASLKPIPVPGIVYSFHMYEPSTFTHQGLYAPANVRYPGVIYGREWNKAKLREVLAPIYRFQQEYNARIFVGEFSAIRWAPGESAYYYLRDCIDLFEEAGWDWCYHAFREYHGWSVEHTTDRANEQPSATPTLRQQLLKEAFGKNKR